MAKSRPARKFDYDQLQVTPADRATLEAIAQFARSQHVSAVKNILANGEKLKTAQAIVSRCGRGMFQRWVEATCGLSAGSAYNQMRIQRSFGNCAAVAQFSVRALTELSRKRTPRKAKKAALRRAKTGKFLTYDDARQLIIRHTPDADTDDRADDGDTRRVNAEIANIKMLILGISDKSKYVLVEKLRDLIHELSED